MKLKSKTILFCSNASSEHSRHLIDALLERNIKTLIIANANGDGGQLLPSSDDARLSHCAGDLTKIDGLEVIFSEALKRTKKLDIVVNHKEISVNDAWEDTITAHINSFICSTLMAIKHTGSMNAGKGCTVLNALVVHSGNGGGDEEEYATIHRLLSDLDRSFSDPYYFNNTAVRILTMCARIASGCGSSAVAADANVPAEAGPMESANPAGDDVSAAAAAHAKLVDKFLSALQDERSVFVNALVEPFEILVQD